MPDYVEGHVKRDPASGSVAIRTNQPVDAPPGAFTKAMGWLAVSTYAGANYVGQEVVEAWDDLFVPPVIDEEP